MHSSSLYRWSRRTGWVIVNLSKKCTSYLAKLSKRDQPVILVPRSRHWAHKYGFKRSSLNSADSCLSEPAAIAISIGYGNKGHSSSILAHSINMALCKDSFTGTMRGFNYDDTPTSWDDFLARTSHVWSIKFSWFLRKKGRKRARGEGKDGWVKERTYKGWTELIVSNLLDFFEMVEDRPEGLDQFDPMVELRATVA